MTNNHELPFSQACENNKAVILSELQTWFAACTKVLEIGSGTGQHAVHFAKGLPHVSWQTSDQPHYHSGINAWIDAYPAPNLRRPLPLTINKDNHDFSKYDGIFTANTAHIMQKEEVQVMQQSIAQALPQQGVFCQYGPFTEQGQFSSESNQAFHTRLLDEGYGGYRDLSELQQWAPELTLAKVQPMPANNLLLVWRKR